MKHKVASRRLRSRLVIISCSLWIDDVTRLMITYNNEARSSSRWELSYRTKNTYFVHRIWIEGKFDHFRSVTTSLLLQCFEEQKYDAWQCTRKITNNNFMRYRIIADRNLANHNFSVSDFKEFGELETFTKDGFQNPAMFNVSRGWAGGSFPFRTATLNVSNSTGIERHN